MGLAHNAHHLFATSNEWVRKPSLGSGVGGMAGTGDPLAKLVEEDKVAPILASLHGLQREQAMTVDLQSSGTERRERPWSE